MPSFTVTAAGQRVNLGISGTAQASFTVTNTSTQTLKGRMMTRPSDSASPDWFSVVGETVRDFAPNAEERVVVQLSVPSTAPPGGTRSGSTRSRQSILTRTSPRDRPSRSTSRRRRRRRRSFRGCRGGSSGSPAASSCSSSSSSSSPSSCSSETTRPEPSRPRSTPATATTRRSRCSLSPPSSASNGSPTTWEADHVRTSVQLHSYLRRPEGEPRCKRWCASVVHGHEHERADTQGTAAGKTRRPRRTEFRCGSRPSASRSGNSPRTPPSGSSFSSTSLGPPRPGRIRSGSTRSPKSIPTRTSPRDHPLLSTSRRRRRRRRSFRGFRGGSSPSPAASSCSSSSQSSSSWSSGTRGPSRPERERFPKIRPSTSKREKYRPPEVEGLISSGWSHSERP